MGHAYSRGHFLGQEFVYVPVNKMSHQFFFLVNIQGVHTVCAHLVNHTFDHHGVLGDLWFKHFSGKWPFAVAL